MNVILVLVGFVGATFCAYNLGRIGALMEVSDRVFKPWIRELREGADVSTYDRAWNRYTEIK